METSLDHDLVTALDGVDVEEFLAAEDPLLASIARDLIRNAEISFDGSPAPIYEGKEPDKEEEKKIMDCLACGKPCKRMRHLGGLVCLSCRAFFVRSVKKGAYKDFLCFQDVTNVSERKQCRINSKSWMSCRSCRFDRCLKAGMVVPEDTDQLAKNAEMLQSVTDKLTLSFKTRMWQCVMNTSGLSSNDIAIVESFPDIQSKIMLKVPELARNNMDSVKLAMEYFYDRDRRYNLYLQKNIYDYQRYCIGEVLLKQSGPLWNSIKYSDRVKLFAQNGPLVLEYIVANRVGRAKRNSEEVRTIIDILMSDPDEAKTSRINSIVMEVSKHGTLKPATLTYDKVYDNRLLGLDTKEAAYR